MLHELRSKLREVRVRQQLDRVLRWGTSGLIVGAILGSLWCVASWIGAPVAPKTAWLVLVGGVTLGCAAGAVWPIAWQSSARLVDGRYGLKDRTLTALDFAGRSGHDALRALQVEDALAHLASVDARRVVPWTMPRLAPAALAVVGVMIALGFLPMSQKTLEANVSSGPLEVVLDQAALLENTMLKELEELAKESKDPALDELAEELKQAVDDLKDPEVDQREALAKLSEMQAELTAAVKALDVEQIDAQLQELAEALQVADATAAASQALKSNQYEKAASELEKIDASTMTKKERDALASNMSKLANKLGQGKKGSLGEALQEIADGFSDEDSAKVKEGMCKAGGVCRRQGTKKKISECLACQLNRLSECKGCCQGSCLNPSSNVAKSDKPSNRAGSGASNQPTGDEKTKLDSNRREENLVGTSGEGPSERETLSTAEARQDAARSFRERYNEFHKQMEEVLDREPLPLSHRETVRKYFEAIRPDNAESELVEQK